MILIHGRIRQWGHVRGLPNTLFEKPGGLADRSPTPHPHRRTRVPFRRPGRNAATRMHLPNSPRHHAGASAAGMRSRAGRYECPHHSRPTVVAGVNIRSVQCIKCSLDIEMTVRYEWRGTSQSAWPSVSGLAPPGQHRKVCMPHAAADLTSARPPGSATPTGADLRRGSACRSAVRLPG